MRNLSSIFLFPVWSVPPQVSNPPIPFLPFYPHRYLFFLLGLCHSTPGDPPVRTSSSNLLSLWLPMLGYAHADAIHALQAVAVRNRPSSPYSGSDSPCCSPACTCSSCTLGCNTLQGCSSMWTLWTLIPNSHLPAPHTHIPAQATPSTQTPCSRHLSSDSRCKAAPMWVASFSCLGSDTRQKTSYLKGFLLYPT